jgi:energy-converting hydrogenase Eha subunit C
MTGAGVTLYLVLAMHNYLLAALAAGLFAPLIGFHFLITLVSKRDDLVRIEGIRRLDENQDSEMAIQRT